MITTTFMLSEVLRRASQDDLNLGDTETEAPYVCITLVDAFVPSPSRQIEIDNACRELFRSNAAFLDFIRRDGVTFYDEMNNPVWHSKDPEEVLHALEVTGQRHFGPILGGNGPRF